MCCSYGLCKYSAIEPEAQCIDGPLATEWPPTPSSSGIDGFGVSHLVVRPNFLAPFLIHVVSIVEEQDHRAPLQDREPVMPNG